MTNNIHQNAQTNIKKPCTSVCTEAHTVSAMKKQTIPDRIAFRPSPEDFTILTKIGAKLGVDNSQVIRIALRRLFELEGLQLKAS